MRGGGTAPPGPERAGKTAFFPRNDRPYGLQRNALQTENAPEGEPACVCPAAPFSRKAESSDEERGASGVPSQIVRRERRRTSCSVEDTKGTAYSAGAYPRACREDVCCSRPIRSFSFFCLCSCWYGVWPPRERPRFCTLCCCCSRPFSMCCGGRPSFCCWRRWWLSTTPSGLRWPSPGSAAAVPDGAVCWRWRCASISRR